jgi:hypothetical protein
MHSEERDMSERNGAAGGGMRLSRRGDGADEQLRLTEGGSALIDASFGGAKKAVMVWPGGYSDLGATFALAALRAQEDGEGAFRAVVYPWRNSGMTMSMKSLMVHEEDIVASARARATVREAAKGDWTPGRAGSEAYDLVMLRLGSVGSAPARRGARPKAQAAQPHPMLDDLFPVFAPFKDGKPGYGNAGDSFLRRIVKHTDIAAVGGSWFDEQRQTVGDPELSPYALFGVPAATGAEPDRFGEWLDAVGGEAPRAVYLDLTANGLKAMGRRWRDKAKRFVAEAEARWPGVSVVAVTDSPKTLDVVTESKAAFMDEREIVLSGLGSLAFPADAESSGLRAAGDGPKWTVAPRDKSVMEIIHSAYDLSSELYDMKPKQSEPGAAVWDLARRILLMNSFPCGWGPLRAHVEKEHRGEVPEMFAKRYFPILAVQRVNAAQKAMAASTDKTVRLCSEKVRELLGKYSIYLNKIKEDTPISQTLRRVVPALAASAGRDKVVVNFCSADARDLFNDILLPQMEKASKTKLRDRVVATWRGDVKHRLLRGEAAKWGTLILVGPTHEDIGHVLSASVQPKSTMVLTDAASAADIVPQLTLVADAADGADWAEGVLALRDTLSDGIGNLPDFTSLFDRHALREAAALIPTEIVVEQPGGGDDTTVIFVGDKNKATLSLRTEIGDIRCADATPVLVLTDDAGTPFRRAMASEVEEGDVVLVPSETMSPTLMTALRGIEYEDAEKRDSLRAYHTAVRKGVAALPWSDLGEERAILALMRKSIPDAPDEELGNIRRWIAVKPGQEKPDAPGDVTRFRAFARAVGIPDADAEAYWADTIEPWRDLRRENGKDLYMQAIAYLEDPDTAAVHLGLSPSTHDAVMNETFSRMARVDSVRRRQEAAPAPRRR